jgi:phenylacetate-CoA ligase
MKNDSNKIYDKSIFLNVNKNKFEKADYLFFSSGTTSNPKIFPITKKDWEKKNKYRAKCYKFAGVTKKDKVAIMLPFGPWIAGSSSQCAMEMLKTKVFPLGVVDTKEEILALLKIIKKNNINILVTTPSFLNSIFYILKNKKLYLNINKIFTSGEAVSEYTRQLAKKFLNTEIYSCYASSESFVGIECKLHDGYHYNPRYIEIKKYKDKFSDNILLLTVKENFLIPIKKYKIGDLGICFKKCKCGSNWPKVKLIGRSENSFLINGAINVFPYQIKNALFSIGLDFIECLVIVKKIKNDKDFIIFEIKTNIANNNISTFIIRRSLKEMSLDFSDAIHHNLIKISVKNRKCKRGINEQKSKIIIKDKRIYE